MEKKKKIAISKENAIEKLIQFSDVAGWDEDIMIQFIEETLEFHYQALKVEDLQHELNCETSDLSYDFEIINSPQAEALFGE